MGVIELAAYVDQFGTDGVAGFVFVDGTAGEARRRAPLPTRILVGQTQNSRGHP